MEVTHPNDPLFNPVWVPKHELRQRVQLSASEDVSGFGHHCPGVLL